MADILGSLSALAEPRKWLEAIRAVPTRVWLTATAMTSLLLLAPTWLASMIGVGTFRDGYRSLIGLGLLVSASFLVSAVLAFIARKALGFAKLWRAKQELQLLAHDQKRILLRYVREEKTILGCRHRRPGVPLSPRSPRPRGPPGDTEADASRSRAARRRDRTPLGGGRTNVSLR